MAAGFVWHVSAIMKDVTGKSGGSRLTGEKTVAKQLIVILILCASSFGQLGRMVAAEKLTGDEKKELAAAALKVKQANDELAETQAKIAGNHKFGKEGYMEWSRWYEFDGDFIIQRVYSYQDDLKPATWSPR